MSELRVPMVALPTRVLCADGREFEGRIFVPAFSSRRSGPMRPEEWMNEPAPFFPFIASDGGLPALLNKRQVLTLSVPAPNAPSDEPEDDVPERLVRIVAVEYAGRHLEGQVHIDMPANQSRVLDYMNHGDDFLALREGGWLHLVQKTCVTRVIELKGE